MAEETREPQRFTGFLLRRAQQQHVATWLRIVGSEPTSIQYGVLSVLARRPGSAQKVLCEELDLDRSTIADLCVRLERNGLVSRSQDREDRRRNVLKLTEAGQAEFSRLGPLVEQVQAELSAGLSEAEIQQLRSLLNTMLTQPK